MAQSSSGSASDVFLSFRGVDTRKNFTDHLYTALVNARINTFRDDRLEKGNVIKEELDNAIQRSRSSVIVLSKEYASSTWCLDELVMILRQRKRTSDYVVLPVFYDVDPSHVRWQTGIVEKAFTMHQETQSSSKLEEWRTALKEVANLAGMNLQTEADGHEAKFIQKIVGEIQDKLGRRPLSDVQEVLKKKLRSANQILNVAEGNQLNNPTVRELLVDLKEAVYDAEDLLQEIKTELLRQEIEQVYECSTSKAQELISTPSYAFDTVLLHSTVDQVLERLDDITKQTKVVLDSAVTAGSNVSQTIPSTPLVEEFGVCGRDEEKETLIKLLLSTDESSNNISVIPIVGMGGIGKTTLAQLLYNDDRVEHHFDKQVWACVSEKFDVLRISQVIYESLTLEACNIVNLNLLQTTLKAILMGRRFFLILDDMWNKSYVEWEVLMHPFQYVAPGSKIIVTTRSQDVASMVCTLEPHRLIPMSEEEGWSLFEKHAFNNAGIGAHPILEKIGRQIVKKCKGLPLAIKSLGGLLCSKSTVREWKSILNSETWELPLEESNILPSLWLSYNDLTLELKRCFEYCSIFPKNYKFERLHLILVWNAVGLLEPDKRKLAEEIGEDYFRDLITRSFFQLSSTDFGLEYYTMHDFHHDLANFVSGEFCVRLEGSDSPKFWSRTRHVNIMSDTFEALHPPKRLRTLISVGRWRRVMRAPLYNLLPKLQSLLVLTLSEYPMEELPDTINYLKHLRQLNLSRTHIRRLPDTVCTLYNLQSLLLSGCKYFIELPANLGRLIKLSHLDITGTSKLERMPQDIGNLKDLQMLTDFVLDKDTAGNNLTDLKKFQILHGSLRISRLVHSSGLETHILWSKMFLNELVLDWGFNNPTVGGREVLEKLQPHLNLERLTIRGFGGKMLGDWPGYYSSSALQYLKLDDCRNCVSLPALGQLPSLRELIIEGLHGVVSIGSEFYYGEGNATTCVNKPFRSLQSLEFSLMIGWKEWSFVGGDDIATFPNLTKLSMERCPKLSLFSKKMHSHLPSLVYLKLYDCENCVSLPALGQLPSLRELIIQSLIGVVSIGSELYYGEGSATTCVNKPFRSLQSLEFTYMNEWKEWSFVGGDDIATFPNLTKLSVINCPKLSLLPEKMHSHLPSLVNLVLWECPQLECYPEGGFPSKLESLFIWGCKKLNAKSVQKLNKGCLRRLTSLERLVGRDGGRGAVPQHSHLSRDLESELRDHGRRQVVWPSQLCSRIEDYQLPCAPVLARKWVTDYTPNLENRGLRCAAVLARKWATLFSFSSIYIWMSFA